MRTALIGYSGFVGSNLRSQYAFDDLYNTSNIADIRGQEYDLVVSAGNRADSFRINNNPDEDLADIDGLIEHVSAARIAKLALVSTVCVYPAGGAPNELTPLSDEGLTPYGRNRLHQERVLSSRFSTLVLRLPQLLGDGLRKGIVYDLANNYRVEHIRPGGEFQYYDVRELWAHLEAARAADLSAFNLATPPLTSDVVARECFGIDISGQVPAEPESPFSAMYTRNMTTVHSDVVGGDGPYLYSADDELERIRAFARSLGSSQPAH
ncbi:MAG: hypothetical protein ABWX65_01590 [Mycetocola sp.]